MNQPKFEMNGSTTISEAIEILKQQAAVIATSEEAEEFNRQNPNWSSLFKAEYKPYRDAVRQYEEALKLSEWLNGKDPKNRQLTIEEAFLKMSDQERLSLFHQRINTDIPSIFDEYLRIWWINRY